MSEQLSLKEQMIVLTRSLVAASSTSDRILIEYATQNLQNFLEQVDLVPVASEDKEEF